MSFLDGVLGGITSAGITALVNEVVQQNGGVQGIVSKFEQGGLSNIVKSWVSTGQNQPVSASQINQVFSSDMIRNLAGKLGIPEEQIANKIAECLPAAIDQMTPNGVVTEAA